MAIPRGPVWKIGRHRLGVDFRTWPPVSWGPFGATGWTPILYRVYVWPFYFSYFYKGQPEKFTDELRERMS